MKKVEAIVRPEKLNAVKAALDAAGFPGMTFTQVMGRGAEDGPFAPRADADRDALPKLRVEVVVRDSDVEHVITAIASAARTGAVGDGRIFVSPVDDAVRVRTGERGEPVL